jgi:hypothetical protein
MLNVDAAGQKQLVATALPTGALFTCDLSDERTNSREFLCRHSCFVDPIFPAMKRTRMMSSNSRAPSS